MTLEPSDLNVELNCAVVVHAKMGDFILLREAIRRDFPQIRLVFNTMSSEYLFIVKKGCLTVEQVRALEDKGERKNGKI